jgi:hypothetical protein
MKIVPEILDSSSPLFAACRVKKAPGTLARTIQGIVASTPADDIHTHLYDPAFGELLLWGIDDLLVYHYLIAETFRFGSISYDQFWALSKPAQAELIWNELFIRHSPLSEACRGVVTTLNRLGLDVKKRDLGVIRKWFAGWKVEEYTEHCMELGGVKSVCMTNSPFDDLERPVWERGFKANGVFKAALRIDPMLVSWEETAPRLVKWGYKVKADLDAKTVSEVRRFLADWTRRMSAQYVMVSLAPDFEYPAKDSCARLIERGVLPHCAEFGIPFAIMPGVKRAVNPRLRLAGDGVGRNDLQALQNLCARHPENKFLCTLLSRENQHEAAVLTRKFPNLHIFGCWWFMNIPTLVDEITRMRLELLGPSFTAQHSDARVLDQLIYKWDHSRTVISRILVEKYEGLEQSGWPVRSAEIEGDVRLLFGGAFEDFLKRKD